jgi:hypothetical protein
VEKQWEYELEYGQEKAESRSDHVRMAKHEKKIFESTKKLTLKLFGGGGAKASNVKLEAEEEEDTKKEHQYKSSIETFLKEINIIIKILTVAAAIAMLKYLLIAKISLLWTAISIAISWSMMHLRNFIRARKIYDLVHSNIKCMLVIFIAPMVIILSMTNVKILFSSGLFLALFEDQNKDRGENESNAQALLYMISIVALPQSPFGGFYIVCALFYLISWIVNFSVSAFITDAADRAEVKEDNFNRPGYVNGNGLALEKERVHGLHDFSQQDDSFGWFRADHKPKVHRWGKGSALGGAQEGQALQAKDAGVKPKENDSDTLDQESAQALKRAIQLASLEKRGTIVPGSEGEETSEKERKGQAPNS